ncbi:hypothetical protein GSI_05198 [Ganoderma sinense ZZ0214-1]|uniref:GmrSD restriction endonucleases N-terminal domain-containing protein n=1 Tax=Ganoderma sinense ZZ0214-1 TaxID=1077348 RepID=A0A2G8SFD7_9APHY|nr:hypothetical protein GSI_05198 [Ganoderma sinense ZZ0214-1]
MSSGSELTDIDEEEELSYGAPTKSKTKGKGKGSASEGGYKIRGALRPPRATTYTCQSLYDQIHGQDIDLQPEYQRDVVWPEKKQIGLIDSIFRNFYIPPVIFVVNAMDDGGERRVCVDGKQRLTSIYRFIGGEIPFKDAFTGERFVFKDTGKIKAQILPDRYRKLFLNKQIVCMEYTDISPDNEREIFQRVQLGMALTPAEKLQAISGGQADFIRTLLDTYVNDELSNSIPWDTSRANDFRGLATAVYTMSRWPKVTTLPSLPVIEAWLQEPDELDEDFCDDVHNTYRIFCAMAKDPILNKPMWLSGVKKVAPVEVMGITILIHARKLKLTMAQLSEAVGLMRKDVRKNEKDIRQNTRTMKIILAFIKELKTEKLKPDPTSPVAIDYPAVSTKAKVKRKKVVNSSSDDEEESRPAPTIRIPTPSRPSTSTSASNTSTAAPTPAPVRAPPTAPSALRLNGSGLPSRPTSTAAPPPQISTQRNNSLSDNLMARVMNQSYDASRDPRNPAYQSLSSASQARARR